MQSVDIYYRPYNFQIISATIDTKYCRYDNGYCIIPDNSTLVWDTNCKSNGCKKCDYEKVQEMEGEYANNIWVSNDKQLALTFEKGAADVTDCVGQKLKVSEQGFAIKESMYQKIMRSPRKTKRSATSLEESMSYDAPDAVRPDQLAAQLTAQSVATTRAISQLFNRECARNHRLENPTLTARGLLKVDNVQARWVKDTILEVWPCSIVNFTDITLRKVETCYKFVPIFYRKKTKGFFDPITRILSHTAQEADCTIFQEHLI
jgi:hypothetical protein